MVFVPRRLDKFLKDATPLTVKRIARAIDEGRAGVNGHVARDAAELIFQDDAVTLDGERVAQRQAHVHLMLNKPLSVTSTARDPGGRADLSRFLSQMPSGVFPIGRLDRDTSGLLLFTTDGDLAHAVLHPDHHTDKVYWLWLDEIVPDDDPRLQRLRDGFIVRGEHVRAKHVEVLARPSDFTELLVTLNEGKNRQIRRMCRALDFYLRALHRRSVGPLSLGDLELGAFRELTSDEVEALWRATGGRERVRERQLAALRFAAERARSAGAPHARLEAWLSERVGS